MHWWSWNSFEMCFDVVIPYGGPSIFCAGGNSSLQRRGSLGKATSDSIPPKSSRFKGVSWHKHSQKWYAYIQAGGKMRGLGYYDDQEDAARAYDTEAKKVQTSLQGLTSKTFLAK
jgi:hypothetical protein